MDDEGKQTILAELVQINTRTSYERAVLKLDKVCLNVGLKNPGTKIDEDEAPSQIVEEVVNFMKGTASTVT